VGKHVGEVEVLSDPVDGDTSYPTLAYALLNYVRFLASIGLHPVYSVVLPILKVDPVNEVTFKVVIKVQDIVTFARYRHHRFFVIFQAKSSGEL